MGIFGIFKRQQGPPTAKWNGSAYKCPKCGTTLTSFAWADLEPMAEGKDGHVTCPRCGTKARLPQE